MTEENFILLDKLDEIAASHQATVAQVALAWLLANPIVTSPIIGATSMKQLDENLGVLDLKLTAEEKNVLDELTTREER
jgi:aryl-alcohol dehydrogenase-like predicted oxidoreductase